MKYVSNYKINKFNNNRFMLFSVNSVQHNLYKLKYKFNYLVNKNFKICDLKFSLLFLKNNKNYLKKYILNKKNRLFDLQTKLNKYLLLSNKLFKKYYLPKIKKIKIKWVNNRSKKFKNIRNNKKNIYKFVYKYKLRRLQNKYKLLKDILNRSYLKKNNNNIFNFNLSKNSINKHKLLFNNRFTCKEFKFRLKKYIIKTKINKKIDNNFFYFSLNLLNSKNLLLINVSKLFIDDINLTTLLKKNIKNKKKVFINFFKYNKFKYLKFKEKLTIIMFKRFLLNRSLKYNFLFKRKKKIKKNYTNKQEINWKKNYYTKDLISSINISKNKSKNIFKRKFINLNLIKSKKYLIINKNIKKHNNVFFNILKWRKKFIKINKFVRKKQYITKFNFKNKLVNYFYFIKLNFIFLNSNIWVMSNIPTKNKLKKLSNLNIKVKNKWNNYLKKNKLIIINNNNKILFKNYKEQFLKHDILLYNKIQLLQKIKKQIKNEIKNNNQTKKLFKIKYSKNKKYNKINKINKINKYNYQKYKYYNKKYIKYTNLYNNKLLQVKFSNNFTRFLIFKFKKKIRIRKFNYVYNKYNNIKKLEYKIKLYKNYNINNIIFNKSIKQKVMRITNNGFFKYWYIFKILNTKNIIFKQYNSYNKILSTIGKKNILINQHIQSFEKCLNNNKYYFNSKLNLYYKFGIFKKLYNYKLYYISLLKKIYYYYNQVYIYSKKFNEYSLKNKFIYFFNKYYNFINLNENNILLYEINSITNDLKFIKYINYFDKITPIRTFKSFFIKLNLFNKYFINEEFIKLKKFIIKFNKYKKFNIINIKFNNKIISFDINNIINNFVLFRQLILYIEWFNFNNIKRKIYSNFTKKLSIIKFKKLYNIINKSNNVFITKYICNFLLLNIFNNNIQLNNNLYWYFAKNSHLSKLYISRRYSSKLTNFQYYAKKQHKFIQTAIPNVLRYYKYHYNFFVKKFLKKYKLRKQIIKYYLIKNNYSHFKLFYLWRWYFVFLSITEKNVNKIYNVDIINLINQQSLLNKYKYFLNKKYYLYFKYLLFRYYNFYKNVQKKKLYATLNANKISKICFFSTSFYWNLQKKDKYNTIFFANLKPTRRNLALFYINITYNNIFVTLCDLKGNVIYKACAGTLGITGSKRSTPVACENVVGHVLFKTMRYGIKYIYVKINGVLYTRKMKSAIKVLKTTASFNIVRYFNITPKAHNGIRLQKKRRI